MFDELQIRKTLRVTLGTLTALGLLALAPMLGFIGLWTYAGFKTTGDPVLGTLILCCAITTLGLGGMTLQWAFTRRALIDTKRVGIFLAISGAALTLWLIASN
jgi:hypothetical protein